MNIYTARRTTMVDTQVRPSDVTKFPIIDAMLQVAREKFVPTSQKETAYVGENLEIGDNRVVLEPRTLAKMLDGLDISPDDLVLDLGCGYGYSSAVIARMAEAVVAVEEDSYIARDAQEALSEAQADNVILHEAPLAEGAPEHGPYDVIIVQGGVASIPAAILDQMKDGARIGAVFVENGVGEARIGYKIDGNITWRSAFNAGAPILPGFEAVVEFTF
ncbi:MAG: protein-L-isoaspartate O-methyltransferase [Rhodobacteraceae bacterium]|nr:protein-L-isoaspartate O-methyltransferase [Paracoccaceae bacterium]